MFSRRRLVAGLSALLGTTPALAGESRLPLDQYEILNDGESCLAPICAMGIYSFDEESGLFYAKGMLSFQPKRTWNWELIIPPNGSFHLVDRFGSPVPIVSIFDDGHHTTKSCWLGATFKRPDPNYAGSLRIGDHTWLIADDVPENRIIVRC